MFEFYNLLQPSCFINESEVQLKRPRGCVPRRIPYEYIVAMLKVLKLLIEKLVISCQAGQKQQRT